jgi:hypothetical protein
MVGTGWAETRNTKFEIRNNIEIPIRANMLEMNAALGAMDGKIRRENVKGKIMVHI